MHPQSRKHSDVDSAHLAVPISLTAITTLGFALHLTRPALQNNFAGHWFELSRDVVGVIGTYPAILLMWRLITGSWKNAGELTFAYFGSFVAVAFGVIVGHKILPDKGG